MKPPTYSETHSPPSYVRPTKVALAYREKSENPNLSWVQIALKVGFKNGHSCRKETKLFALRHSLPWPFGREFNSVGKRQKLLEKESRGSKAYQLRSEKGMEWVDISLHLEGKPESLYLQAERYALTRGLPWPLPAEATRERDLLAERVFEVVLRERNIPGKSPKSWAEISLLCGVTDAEELARQHIRKTGKKMPECRNRARVFGETCYRLRSEGLTWMEVSKKAGIKRHTHACAVAATYARENNLQWPILLDNPSAKADLEEVSQ